MLLTRDNTLNDYSPVSNEENADEEETWTSIFTEHDVLAIRGVGQNKNPGNLLFRDLVADRKAKYENSSSAEYRRQLGEEIVALIKPGRFLKKEDSSQSMFRIMDHQSAVTKATFAIRDLKVGAGGISKRQKYKREEEDLSNSNNNNNDNGSDVLNRRKNKDTSTERKSKMTESIEMKRPSSTSSVLSKSNNKRSKRSITKTAKNDNSESSDLSDSDLESKASSRASIGSKNQRRKTTTSNSAAIPSPRKGVNRVKRKYSYKNLSDYDDSEVEVIDLLPKLQLPSKRHKTLTPSSHIQEPKIAIPFRGYGFPFTVYVRFLMSVTESTAAVHDPPTLSYVDISASKELVALKHLKL